MAISFVPRERVEFLVEVLSNSADDAYEKSDEFDAQSPEWQRHLITSAVLSSVVKQMKDFLLNQAPESQGA